MSLGLGTVGSRTIPGNTGWGLGTSSTTTTCVIARVVCLEEVEAATVAGKFSMEQDGAMLADELSKFSIAQDGVTLAGKLREFSIAQDGVTVAGKLREFSTAAAFKKFSTAQDGALEWEGKEVPLAGKVPELVITDCACAAG